MMSDNVVFYVCTKKISSTSSENHSLILSGGGRVLLALTLSLSIVITRMHTWLYTAVLPVDDWMNVRSAISASRDGELATLSAAPTKSHL